jgi:hypothetical protein
MRARRNANDWLGDRKCFYWPRYHGVLGADTRQKLSPLHFRVVFVETEAIMILLIRFVGAAM